VSTSLLVAACESLSAFTQPPGQAAAHGAETGGGQVTLIFPC